MSGSTTSPAGIPSPTDPAIEAAVAGWVAAAPPDDAAAALAAVVERIADARDLRLPFVVDGFVIEPSRAVLDVDVDPETLRRWAPWLPGFVREAVIASAERRRSGVHHTSPEMASTLVDFVGGIRPWEAGDLVVDPAVGGGAFLLAAGMALPGEPPERLAQLRGCDIDPLAVATTVASLRVWADGAPIADGAIVVADALEDPWPGSGATVVVGNPPFRSQLRDGTVRNEARRDAMARRWPELGGYVDDAAAFLLAGVDHVEEGGVVALVQPSSFFAARDAAPVRARLRQVAPPVGVWIDGARQFAASVDTAAVVVRKGAAASPVRRARGVPAETLASHEPIDRSSWASLLLVDTPALDRDTIRAGGTLGEVAHVTAGFRDQFYGLRGAVAEGVAGHPWLVTVGLIDPLTCRWGDTSCRFDKQRWTRPTVDPGAVAPAIRSWVADRLVPKLVVATQTRVLEVVIDSRGDLVPCTPVVTVEPMPGAPSLAHLAAALTSPLASLLALQDSAGSALSSDAMRVSARLLSGLPLPIAGPEWDAAAAAVTALDGPPTLDELARIGQLGLVAYGLGERADVANWWRGRLRGR